MSKLLKWKAWLTLPEAASHLSAVLQESATEADLLRLALEGHLKLSVNLVNFAYGKKGRVTLIEEAGTRTLPVPITLQEDLTEPDSEGRRRRRVDAPNRGWTESKFPNGSVINELETIIFSDDVRKMEGIWDLPMIGGERIDIEQMLQERIGGPDVALINIDGGLLSRPSDQGEIWAVMEPFKRKEINRAWFSNPSAPQFTGKMVSDYMPAPGLPERSLVVVRTDELQRFLAEATGIAFSPNRGVHWPPHDTSRLAALRHAAHEWWSTYEDGVTDPPSSKEVTLWLMRNHGISEELASAMAAILRPDGLKPGPRRRNGR